MAKDKRRSRGPRIRISNAPLRLAAGAYIMNTGVTHLEERERAADLHKAAITAYPKFDRMKPEQFLLLLAGGEAALGAALLLPTVSPRVAGLGLAGFSTALLGMYARQGQFRRSDASARPSREGEALAKDVWLLGIALALLLQRRPSPLWGKPT